MKQIAVLIPHHHHLFFCKLKIWASSDKLMGNPKIAASKCEA